MMEYRGRIHYPESHPSLKRKREDVKDKENSDGEFIFGFDAVDRYKDRGDVHVFDFFQHAMRLWVERNDPELFRIKVWDLWQSVSRDVTILSTIKECSQSWADFSCEGAKRLEVDPDAYEAWFVLSDARFPVETLYEVFRRRTEEFKEKISVFENEVKRIGEEFLQAISIAKGRGLFTVSDERVLEVVNGNYVFLKDIFLGVSRGGGVFAAEHSGNGENQINVYSAFPNLRWQEFLFHEWVHGISGKMLTQEYKHNGFDSVVEGEIFLQKFGLQFFAKTQNKIFLRGLNEAVTESISQQLLKLIGKAPENFHYEGDIEWLALCQRGTKIGEKSRERGLQFFDAGESGGDSNKLRKLLLDAYFEEYDPEKEGHKIPLTKKLFLYLKKRGDIKKRLGMSKWNF